ncbi:MAG: hypothetical protein ABFR53_01205 [Actinomycetota bacterium]
MTRLDTQKEAVTKAAKTVTDATVSAGTKAVDFTATTAKTVADSPVVTKTREVSTTTAKTVVDSPVVVKAKEVTTTTAKTVNDHSLVVKVKELGASAASTTTDTAKVVFDKASTVATTALDMVSDLPLGGKNVGERAQQTVDTVQDKIDVDQLHDQVAKLRHQIDGVVESWQESFRPSAAHKAEAQVKETVKKAAPATKTAAKKATTTAKKAAPATKTAAKKTAAKK